MRLKGMATKMQALNDTVPHPDPTDRTREQLLREVAMLRELSDSKNECTREILETRLVGMDKAISLAQQKIDEIPRQRNEAIVHLQALHEEKFSSIGKQVELLVMGLGKQVELLVEGIGTQFAERDKRSEQLSIADKTAVNAALAAQEKQAIAQNEATAAAAAKQEAAFTKQIDNIVALFTKQIDGIVSLLQVNTSNSDKQFQDLKGRFDKGEGVGRGQDKSADRVSVNLGLIISGIGGFLGFVGAIAAVAAILSRGPQSNGGVVVPPPVTVTPR